jgi:hypothetical protein
MAFLYPALLLLGQLVQHLTQTPSQLPVRHLAAALRHEIQMVLVLGLPGDSRLQQHLLTYQAVPLIGDCRGLSLESYEFFLDRTRRIRLGYLTMALDCQRKLHSRNPGFGLPWHLRECPLPLSEQIWWAIGKTQNSAGGSDKMKLRRFLMVALFRVQVQLLFAQGGGMAQEASLS